MAIHATTVWEVRTTGTVTNGGGFADLAPGTSVDYSQQDAAELTLTDIVSDVSGTGISSVTGGFTAAMVGNTIHITADGGFTAQWYQITEYTDTNNVLIDRSAGVSKSAGTCYVGGAKTFGSALDNDWISTSASNGNVFWIKYGTYSVGEVVVFSLYSRVVGYNTTRGDRPTLENRPTFLGANSSISLPSNGVVENFIFDIPSQTYQVTGLAYGKMYNCKVYDSTDTCTTSLCSVTTGNAVFVECEFIGTSQMSVNYHTVYSATNSRFINCYFHGPANAILCYGGNAVVSGCIFSGGLNGLKTGISACLVINCLFYDCQSGVEFGNASGTCFINNIFVGNVKALENTTTGTPQLFNYTNHCCFYDNITDFDGGTLDDTDITTDPLLTNPAAGDFTLSAGSPCFDTGSAIGTTVGL